ncbi:hypothetical protein [Archangium lansingense]|uniref:Outer membrane protein beta-barrel domain-containing protein n=1 Tax=Archangium lansingense TaxID=2995310 RepID=A0ABT4AHZ7_9BACT|nr:hypothetical protein [Archangium lansinium]MCY1081297.1 hypothetical protein [Archangium lansinium]
MLELQKKLVALATGLALAASTGVSHAQEPVPQQPVTQQPVMQEPAAPPPAAPKPFLAFTARRMVLPERTLLPYSHLLVAPASTPQGSTSIGLNIGMMYGFGSGWMLDAVFAPLKLASAFSYGNPELALTREIIRSKPFELSVSTRALFRSNIADGGPLGGFELGVPMFFRLGERFRLDVAAYLPFSVSQRPIGALGVTRAGLRAPMAFYYQVHPNFLVALGTGLNARELSDVSGTFSVPVSFNVGFNTNINGFWLDVFPYVALPAFYSQAGVNMKAVAIGLFVDVARRL